MAQEHAQGPRPCVRAPPHRSQKAAPRLKPAVPGHTKHTGSPRGSLAAHPVWRRGGCNAPRIATCRTGGSTPAPLLLPAAFPRGSPRHAGALQTEPIPPSGAAGKGEQQGFGLPQLLLQMDSSTMLGSGTPGQHNHSTAEPGLGARNAAGELWSRLTPLLSTGYLKQPSEPSQNGHNKQRFTLHGNTATECA